MTQSLYRILGKLQHPLISKILKIYFRESWRYCQEIGGALDRCASNLHSNYKHILANLTRPCVCRHWAYQC